VLDHRVLFACRSLGHYDVLDMQLGWTDLEVLDGSPFENFSLKRP
jgi:hypothetical protein